MRSDSLNELSKKIHSPVPFWFLNGDITQEDVVREFQLMRDKDISELIVHPRYGLQVEYLSDGWFEIFGWCVEEAKKHGMYLWIYDELNWPSGTAGMTVQEANPNFQSKHLTVDSKPLSDLDLSSFQMGKYVVAANMEGGSVTKTRVIESISGLESLTGNWVIFNYTLKYDKYYVDTLSFEAINYFKTVTYDEYYKRFGDEFGKCLRAIFTDEPSIYWVSAGYDNCNLPYTDDFFETFEKRFGYSAIEKIPHLFHQGSSSFRADFWDHAGFLFNERYHGNLSAWCREHGIIYTGHNNHEEPLRYQIRFQGNMFDTMRTMDIPGVDHLLKTTLGNGFISIIGHKICSSVTHFSGKSRCLSESFGIMDWDTTYTHMKRVVDWQYALGINLLVPHALFHTTAGFTKRESPPSFFYQSPHWQDFEYFSNYLGNMENMLCGGKHKCKTAVMYPLSGLWATYQSDSKTSDFEHIDNFLNSLCLELVKNQIDFDLLDYTALNEATLEDGKIKIADEEYHVLIVPSTPYIRQEEVLKLTEVVKAGVNTTLFHKAMEPLRHNIPDGLKGANFVRGDELTSFVDILRKQLDDDVQISGGGADDIMAYRREQNGRKITFLLNRSEKHRKVMATIKDYPDAAIFDQETGTFTHLEGKRAGSKTQVELRFQPNQSYFIVSDVIDAINAKKIGGMSASVPLSPLSVSLPYNVASIYHFSYSKDGIDPIEMDIRTNPRFIPVNWDANPPDFDEYAGLYETVAEVNLPSEGIRLIVDSDYSGCKIYLNGVHVELQKNPTIFLNDRQDLWADVSELLKHGKNTFRVLSPTKLSEPLRMVGNFRVHMAEKTVVMLPHKEIDPLKLEENYPYYSGTISYKTSFDLEKSHSSLILDLHSVYDSATVRVNGKAIGKRLWAPYTLDLADYAVVGHNKLEIEVRNNMANLIMGEARQLGLPKMPTLTAIN